MIRSVLLADAGEFDTQAFDMANVDELVATVKTLRKNVEKLKQEQERIVQDATLMNEAQIIELNTEDQLYMKGIDATGKPLQPSYAPLTVTVKRLKNQPTDRVTLRDEGDFHGSFKISYGRGAIAFFADDPKAMALERKYGVDIFGLTDANVKEMIDIVRDDIIKMGQELILDNI